MEKQQVWVAVVGITLADGTRLERGDLYPGRPPKWLVDQGHVVKGDD